MLTFFATLSDLPSLQAAAAALLTAHPTSALLFITLLLFGAAELLKYLRRRIARHSVESRISIAKTGNVHGE
jgi:hypothetical protein